MSGAGKQYITIGKVVNTQGHRGEVRVLPLTDFPQRFEGMQSVLLEQNGRLERRGLERAYRHGKFVILKFTGVDDMNTAETLKNAELLVTREELTPLPPGSHYIFDLVGLQVYTTGGRHLGRVTEVIQTGANDVYAVQGETKRPLLIPALKQVVRSIDLASGKMVVELPAGLEEI